jgi:phospholipase/carboxylesterase
LPSPDVPSFEPGIQGPHAFIARLSSARVSLEFDERPAAGEPAGLLLLHHGRGADEHDLIGLAELLDPDRRLHVVAPGGPLRLAGWPGRHWYTVPRVGHPDPETFHASVAALAGFHDRTAERLDVGPERTVLGGFSMGAVMSYALGLAAERPAPAGILAFSGFIPTVDGWEPSTVDRGGLPVLIAHGRLDGVIPVDFAHAARDLLSAAGLPVEYHESDVGHQIDPASIAPARDFLDRVLA